MEGGEQETASVSNALRSFVAEGSTKVKGGWKGQWMLNLYLPLQRLLSISA